MNGDIKKFNLGYVEFLCECCDDHIRSYNITLFGYGVQLDIGHEETELILFDPKFRHRNLRLPGWG